MGNYGDIELGNIGGVDTECRATVEEVSGAYSASSWAPPGVVPLNADLGVVGEGRVWLAAIEDWPGWFNLRCHQRPSTVQGWPASLVGRWRARRRPGRSVPRLHQ